MYVYLPALPKTAMVQAIQLDHSQSHIWRRRLSTVAVSTPSAHNTLWQTVPRAKGEQKARPGTTPARYLDKVRDERRDKKKKKKKY
jgi:hypothetical protein